MTSTVSSGATTAPAAPKNSGRSRHPVLWLTATVILILVLLPFSFVIGEVPLSFQDAWNAYANFDPQNTNHLLIRELRMPRTVLAIIVGAGLGAAGVIMQALTRNPLAEPGLLGVNSGTTLFVVIAIAFFGMGTLEASMLVGFIGAGLAGAAVYLLGGVRSGGSPVRLVLAGAALNVVLGAATQIVLVNQPTHVFDQYRSWTVGSLEGRSDELIMPTLIFVAAGFILAWLLSGALDASALGQDFSRSLGTNPNVVLALSALAIIVMCGAATAAAGPVSFVGLTAPFIARYLVGLNHRKLLPTTAIIAAAVVLVADVVGRMIMPSGEVGVGIMISLIGAPLFVAIVRNRKIAQL